MANNDTDQIIEIESVVDVSPHNRALYEAGKNILIESISTGREFCKFMTTTTIGAIPTYLALLKLVQPKDYVLKSPDEIIFFIPAILLLISTIIFVIGYFPQKGTLSLDLPNDIERERSATINRRQRYAAWGFLVFCVAVVLATYIIVRAIKTGNMTK
jgi:hypothetical protein